MKRVLVTSAGGAPGIGFARSLRAAPEEFHLIGVDADKFLLHRANVDEKYLVPRASEEDYIPVLHSIIRETRPDLLWVQLSAEMLAISAARDCLETRVFLPRHETIEVCEDKLASQRVWEKAGLPAPLTRLIESEKDLVAAFQELGPKIWLRAIRGSGGKDSLPTDNPEAALAWLRFKGGWGKVTAAECLEQETVTWQSIWKDGDLVVAQARKRLYWEFAALAPSGVTGLTGTGETVTDPVLDEVAMAAVLAVDPRPNGVLGVDLTYDRSGVPNLTEINSGRFFTTHQFFTAAGLNMPYIVTQVAIDAALPPLHCKLNPLPPGLLWVRGFDSKPVLTNRDQVNETIAELNARRKSWRSFTREAASSDAVNASEFSEY